MKKQYDFFEILIQDFAVKYPTIYSRMLRRSDCGNLSMGNNICFDCFLDRLREDYDLEITEAIEPVYRRGKKIADFTVVHGKNGIPAFMKCRNKSNATYEAVMYMGEFIETQIYKKWK